MAVKNFVCMQNAALRKKLSDMQQNVAKVFNSDQLQSLHNRSRSTRWLPATVKKALQIRYACGSRGYEFLRSCGYPLPAYRTLSDKVQSLDMAPGVDIRLIDMLASKLSVFSPAERDCCLLIDEVQLKEKLEYDKGLKRLMGTVTEQLNSQNSDLVLASHALCFMVRGIRTNWKQIVAWFATGNSVSGVTQWEIAKKIIQLLHERGVTVLAVVSDMGPNNQAMWKHLGICSKRDIVINSVAHPSCEGSRLFFLADVPHLLKNLRNMLLTHDLTLPDSIIRRYCLPCPKVYT
jgi:hypothetical protein